MTFKKGKSGNPNGRPKGIADKRTEYRNLLEPHANELIEKLVEKAKEGDIAALKLCIERLIPRIKEDNSIKFDLPEGGIDGSGNMLEISNRITQAVITGELSIDEAKMLNKFLHSQRIVLRQAKVKQREEELWE